MVDAVVARRVSASASWRREEVSVRRADFVSVSIRWRVWGVSDLVCVVWGEVFEREEERWWAWVWVLVVVVEVERYDGRIERRYLCSAVVCSACSIINHQLEPYHLS